MQGIDISNWQNGINLAAVPCDFVICKATQGTGYISPDFHRQIEQALSLGKLAGAYHYIDGSNPEDQARHFINVVKPYIGKITLDADWEKDDNSAFGDNSHLDRFLKKVKELSGIGVNPLTYASVSVFPWATAAANNSGPWAAQYADNNPTGYQETPWNEGTYSCVIRQYSSTGRLDGWGGNLDINKAYMDPAAWMLYANPNGGTPIPIPTPVDPKAIDVTDLAVEVLEGRHGTGEDRKASLGSRYQEVQDLINHISDSSAETLASETWAGKYGNGSKRKALLNTRYDEVMAVINGESQTVYTVQKDDTLSGIATKYGTTYQKLAEANGILNPGLIYPGQRIVIP